MDLSNYKAHELKEIIAKKEASVEEVIKAHLDKIENVDSKVDAFLYVAKEESLEGDGWRLITEDTNEEAIDPRLAKLKDYIKE